jgi:hypothetical protein
MGLFGKLAGDRKKSKNSIKVNIMYFITEKTAKMMKGDVIDGLLHIEGKTYQLTKESVGFLKKGKKVEPFILIKHDVPVALIVDGEKLKYTAENLDGLINNKTLQQLINPPPVQTLDTLLWIIVGGLLGGMTVAIMFYSGMVSI